MIGGGASGMAAAISAAKAGASVSLFEKNERLGKKLFITGKGRCNLTNASDIKTFMEQIVTNPKFLYGAFGKFTNGDTMDFFTSAGCPVKTERGNRVFPVSDHSADVIDALQNELKKYRVKINLRTAVEELQIENGICTGLVLSDKTKICSDAVIVSTGGLSYPSTGSDGDGYRFAKSCGHRVTELYPSLVPLTVMEPECGLLQGLSLKNVRASLWDNDKEIFSEFGEMLFTHFGVSGPLILSASSAAAPILKKRPLKLLLDLKPALSEEKLDARMLRDFSEEKNRELKNSLSGLFPAGLIPEVIRQSGIDPDRRINALTRTERASLIKATKELTFTVLSVRGYSEAVITKGGVDVREINPSSMESKRIQNLYFAGEVLDVDALTGGYNLQIAWSTGWTAGLSAAKKTFPKDKDQQS